MTCDMNFTVSFAGNCVNDDANKCSFTTVLHLENIPKIFWMIPEDENCCITLEEHFTLNTLFFLSLFENVCHIVLPSCFELNI